MRIKTPKPQTPNLLLYTFLGVLFFAAAQVDIDAMSTSAMEHHNEYVDQFIGNAFP